MLTIMPSKTIDICDGNKHLYNKPRKKGGRPEDRTRYCITAEPHEMYKMLRHLKKVGCHSLLIDSEIIRGFRRRHHGGEVSEANSVSKRLNLITKFLRENYFFYNPNIIEKNTQRIILRNDEGVLTFNLNADFLHLMKRSLLVTKMKPTLKIISARAIYRHHEHNAIVMAVTHLPRIGFESGYLAVPDGGVDVAGYSPNSPNIALERLRKQIKQKLLA